MVGVLASAYPQRARNVFRTSGKEHMLPSPRKFADVCLQLCTAARGPAYLDRAELNVYDAATSYFIGQIYAHTGKHKPACRYLAESLTIIRNLDLDKNLEGRRAFEAQIDLITQELGRRIYWTIFADVK